MTKSFNQYCCFFMLYILYYITYLFKAAVNIFMAQK